MMSTPITAAMVNDLRKRTDLPLMECKSALTENGGDMEKAIEWLRARFAKVAIKRGDNETAEGRVSVFIDEGSEAAAIFELRCESAPTAKNDAFITLASELAKQVVKSNPSDVEALKTQPFVDNPALTVTERINEVIGTIRENMKPQQFIRLTGGLFGSYIHHDGTGGVLVQVKGEKVNAELLRDVSAHAFALNPPYALLSEIPADVLAKEKDLAARQVAEDPKNATKPANIIEKIVEGKVRTWASESVLVEQPIANAAKYNNQTVGQLLKGAGLELVKVVRLRVGSTAA
jgi:elongation factor Ts